MRLGGNYIIRIVTILPKEVIIMGNKIVDNNYIIDGFKEAIEEAHDLYQVMDTAYNIGSMNLPKKLKLLREMDIASGNIAYHLNLIEDCMGNLLDTEDYSVFCLVYSQLIGWMNKAREELIRAIHGLKAQVEFDIEQAQNAGDEFFTGVSPRPDWMGEYEEGRKGLLEFINKIDEFFEE